MKKFTIYNLRFLQSKKGKLCLQFTIPLLLITYLLSLITFKVYAQNCQFNNRNGGLISTPQIVNGSIFGNRIPGHGGGTCVGGSDTTPLNQAAFVPFKIPGYDDLKAIYYTQAKANLSATKNPVFNNNTDQTYFGSSLSGSTDQLYDINGNLTLSGPISGTRTGIVFVEGNLTIGPIAGNKFTYGTNSSGLVFVTKGNITIDNSVTQIDAILVSQGVICTGFESGIGCPTGTRTNPTTTQPLVVNGSLIALNSTAPINFRRWILNSNVPAEKINQQPKYFAILNKLFSQSFMITTEDTNYASALSVISNPPPPPTANPLFFWHMDDPSGPNIIDSNGGINGLAVGGAQTQVAGKVNSARQFSAQADQINTNSVSLGLFDMTMGAWIYPTGSGEIWNVIASQWTSSGASWNFSYSTGNQLHFHVLIQNGAGCTEAGYATDSQSFAPKTWHYVAITRSASSGQTILYRDGIADLVFNTTPGPLCNTAFPITFGRFSWDATQRMVGKLDEFAIWNRVLSQLEIRSLCGC